MNVPSKDFSKEGNKMNKHGTNICGLQSCEKLILVLRRGVNCRKIKFH